MAFVAELPHTATGKLLKTKLRETFKDYRLPESPPRGLAKAPARIGRGSGSRPEAGKIRQPWRTQSWRMQRRPDLRKAGGWVIVWGVLLIVAGIVAIVEPAIAAVATALLLAWLFVFAGIVELVYAFQQRAHDGFGLEGHFRAGRAGAGRLHAGVSRASIASLALLIGAFLVASGVSSVMLAFRLRPKQGWGWVLFDGVLSIVIAIMIASGWPQNSIDFVGILVGFCLISGGLWRIMLGRALRSDRPAPESATAALRFGRRHARTWRTPRGAHQPFACAAIPARASHRASCSSSAPADRS